MNTGQGKLNTHFTHVLFATLKQMGIDHIFMAPGSRSCPLSLAAHHYASMFYTHFDERALAFMALGKIKSDGKPAIVITTSGTAVGNLLPALMEASASKLPLLLITADRPIDFHDKGAHQTIKQTGIFDDFVVSSKSLDAPQNGFNDKALSSLLSFLSVRLKEGPVHLNIPLHEPLFDPACDFPHDVEFRKEIEDLNGLKIHGKTLIILGENTRSYFPDPIFFETLSNRLDAPLVIDIASGYREFGLTQLRYYPLILESLELKIDHILHFGTKIISKSLENFLKSFQGTYIHFETSNSLYDPYHKITQTLRGSRKHLEQQALEITPQNHSFMNYLYDLTLDLDEKLDSVTDQYSRYEEAMYVHLFSKIQRTDLNIFIGNSLPIRHFDSFYFPKVETSPIFTQRGVSGIDGLISTACGLSLNTQFTFAFLGDLSSLYDINGLSLITKNKLSVIPIIFNNHGGGIFNYLPIAQQTSHFDKIMSTPHELHFKEIAHGFDLDYIHISSLEEFESFLKNPSPFTLVEIVSDKSGNPIFLDAVKNALCSTISNLKSPPTLLSSSMDS
jgi:2-succinyl-5-enolpyruvyl-6-hydroxy-3-cyclohexene-1-carboxylate synthase